MGLISLIGKLTRTTFHFVISLHFHVERYHETPTGTSCIRYLPQPYCVHMQETVTFPWYCVASKNQWFRPDMTEKVLPWTQTHSQIKIGFMKQDVLPTMVEINARNKCSNARNKCLTAKHLQQGYRYHKLRKTFSKFYRRHYELISKYNVGLKTLSSEGLSEPEFYGDLVYKFKKLKGRYK